MSATAIQCKMCGEPCTGEWYAKTFKGHVCPECAECCRDAQDQLKRYGQRAGIKGETNEPETP